MNKKILNYIDQKGKNNITIALKGIVDGGLSQKLKNYSIREDLENDRVFFNLVELETRKGDNGFELIRPILTMMRLYNDRIEYCTMETPLYDEKMPIRYYENEEQEIFEVVEIEPFEDLAGLISTIRKIVVENSRPNERATYYPYSIDQRSRTEKIKEFIIIASIMAIVPVYAYSIAGNIGLAVGVTIALVINIMVWYYLSVFPHVKYRGNKLKSRNN
ncbi:MAG: hypothetical protein E7254_04995 [Lachnospiraceae bacterium]|nr:hypothetical protein [Lachnospiraceae bacterium]